MDKRKELQTYWEKEIKPQLDPLHNAAGNLLYYVFQTPYHFQPELLIVGINPGGDYDGIPFLDRETNWYTEGEKYPFSNRMCAVFGRGENEQLFKLLENAVGMNKVFFNSGTVEKLKKTNKKEEMETLCGKITEELIDRFIQPTKWILAMGNNPFYGVKGKGEKVESFKLGNAIIKKSKRNGIPVYYIPNPSGRNYRYYSENQIKLYQEYFVNEFLTQKH